jgi:hypothetical protein
LFSCNRRSVAVLKYIARHTLGSTAPGCRSPFSCVFGSLKPEVGSKIPEPYYPADPARGQGPLASTNKHPRGLTAPPLAATAAKAALPFGAAASGSKSGSPAPQIRKCKKSPPDRPPQCPKVSKSKGPPNSPQQQQEAP